MKTKQFFLSLAAATLTVAALPQAASAEGETPTASGWTKRTTVGGKEYMVVAFTDTNPKGFTWTVPKNVTRLDYLVVGGGGGGGGGGSSGGGGGAGGFLTGSLAVEGGDIASIVVGAGGSGAVNANQKSSNGGDSSLTVGEVSRRAIGGGAGGPNGPAGSVGADGGSGGGSAGWFVYGSNWGRTVDPEQGNDAGIDGGFSGGPNPQTRCGGGGGGAGTKGGVWVTQTGGTAWSGGEGRQSAIACSDGETPLWYAAGGGGGTWPAHRSDPVNKGGSSVGGDGGGGPTISGFLEAKPGVDGTGSGGGGGGNHESKSTVSNAGAAGGSGIVILRYLIPGGGSDDDEQIDPRYGYVTYVSIAGVKNTLIVYTNTPASGVSWAVPEKVESIDYLVVGGGGGGGHGGATSAGGGGGAGAFHEARGATVTPGDVVQVVVGAGGAAGAISVTAENGGDSSLKANSGSINVVSVGGGGGGSGKPETNQGTTGNEGASGGANAGRVGGVNKGLDGFSSGSNSSWSAGGGGGAGGNGGNARESYYGGDGGAGVTSDIFGDVRAFAAGGGGGAINSSTSAVSEPGKGGCGPNGDRIGGDGGTTKGPIPSTSGRDGTGSGGGGGGSNGAYQTLGDGSGGGSGLVVIRYITPAESVRVSLVAENVEVDLENALSGAKVSIQGGGFVAAPGDSFRMTLTSSLTDPVYSAVEVLAGATVDLARQSKGLYAFTVTAASEIRVSAAEAGAAELPETAFAYRATPKSVPGGWFDAWAADKFANKSMALGPGGFGLVYRVTPEACPANATLPAAKPEARSVAVYADISAVAEKGTLVTLGGTGGTGLAIVRSGEGVALAKIAAGGTVTYSAVAAMASRAGYHLFSLSVGSDGAALAIDGVRAAVTDATKAADLAAGLSLGAGKVSGDGLRVAAVVGFDAKLTPAQEQALAARYPASRTYSASGLYAVTDGRLDAASLSGPGSLVLTRGTLHVESGTALSLGGLSIDGDGAVSLEGGTLRVATLGFDEAVGTVGPPKLTAGLGKPSVLTVGEPTAVGTEPERKFGQVTFAYEESGEDGMPLELVDASVGTTFKSEGAASVFAGTVSGAGKAIVETSNGGSVTFRDFRATGGIVVRGDGFAQFPAGCEGAADVGAGATLKLLVSAEQMERGYTASAVRLATGAKIVFVRPSGVETEGTGPGGNVFEPIVEQSVKWTGEAGDNRWSTAGNWSTRSVPEMIDTVTFARRAEVILDGKTCCAKVLYVNASVTLDDQGAGTPFAVAEDGIVIAPGCGLTIRSAGDSTVSKVSGGGRFVKAGDGRWTVGAVDGAIVQVDAGEVKVSGGEVKGAEFAVKPGATATVLGDATFVGGLRVASGTLALGEGDFALVAPLTGSGTLALGMASTLTVDPKDGSLASFGGLFGGKGRVKISAASMTSAFKDANLWNGTVEISGAYSDPTLDFSAFANAKSTVCLNGVSGYFGGGGVVHRAGTFEIGPQGLTISGSIPNTTYKFLGRLTGSGKISVTAYNGTGASPANKSIWFVGDMSGFAGSLSAAPSSNTGFCTVFTDKEMSMEEFVARYSGQGADAALADLAGGIVLNGVTMTSQNHNCSKRTFLVNGARLTATGSAFTSYLFGDETATLVLSGTAGATSFDRLAALADPAYWRGHLVFRSFTFSGADQTKSIRLAACGNAQSRLTVDGAKGTLAFGNAAMAEVGLELTGAGLTLDQTTATHFQFPSLVGGGDLTITGKAGVENDFLFAGASQYGGAVTVKDDACVILGGSMRHVAGGLVVGGRVVVASGKTWTAARKLQLLPGADVTCNGAFSAAALEISDGVVLRGALKGSFDSVSVAGTLNVYDSSILPGDALVTAKTEPTLESGAKCLLNGVECELEVSGNSLVVKSATAASSIAMAVVYGRNLASANVTCNVRMSEEKAGTLTVIVRNSLGEVVGTQSKAVAGSGAVSFAFDEDIVRGGDYVYEASLTTEGGEGPSSTAAVNAFAATVQPSEGDGWIRENGETYAGSKPGTGLWRTFDAAHAKGMGEAIFVNTYDEASETYRSVDFEAANPVRNACGAEYRFKAVFDDPVGSAPEQDGKFGITLWNGVEADGVERNAFMVLSNGFWHVASVPGFVPNAGDAYLVRVVVDEERHTVSYFVQDAGGRGVSLGSYELPAGDVYSRRLTFSGVGSLTAVEGDLMDPGLVRATVSFGDDGVIPGQNFTNLAIHGSIRLEDIWENDAGGGTIVVTVRDRTGAAVASREIAFSQRGSYPLDAFLESVSAGEGYTVDVKVVMDDPGSGQPTLSGDTDTTQPSYAARETAARWIDEDAATFAGEREGTGIWTYERGKAIRTKSAAVGDAIGVNVELAGSVDFTSTRRDSETDMASLREFRCRFTCDTPGFNVSSPSSPSTLSDKDIACLTLAYDELRDKCYYAVLSNGVWAVSPVEARLGEACEVAVVVNYRDPCVAYYVIEGGVRRQIATVLSESLPEPSGDYRNKVRFTGSGAVASVEGDCYDSHLAAIGNRRFWTVEDAVKAASVYTNTIAPLWPSVCVVSGRSGSFAVDDPNGYLTLVWKPGHAVTSYKVGNLTYYVFRASESWIDWADANGVVRDEGGYTVLTEAGLAWLAKESQRAAISGTVTLGNDLNGMAEHEWSPIAGFSGVFEGNGHAIVGLKSGDDSLVVTNDGVSAYGLVAVAKDATFRNLTLDGVVISNAADAVAALVGRSTGSVTVEGVRIGSGDVVGDGAYVAGVVALADGFTTVVLACNTNEAAVVARAVRAAGGEIAEGETRFVAGIANLGTPKDMTNGGSVEVTDNVARGALATAFDIGPHGGNVAAVVGGTDAGARFAKAVATGNVGESDTTGVKDGLSNYLVDVGVLPVVNFASAVGVQDGEWSFKRFVEANDADAAHPVLDRKYGTAVMDGSLFKNGETNKAGQINYALTQLTDGQTYRLAKNTDIWVPIELDRNLTFDLNGLTLEQSFEDQVAFKASRNSTSTVKNGTALVPKGMFSAAESGSAVNRSGVNVVEWTDNYWERVAFNGVPVSSLHSIVRAMEFVRPGVAIEIEAGTPLAIDPETSTLTYANQPVYSLSPYCGVTRTVGPDGTVSYEVAFKAADRIVPDVALNLDPADAGAAKVVVTDANTHYEYALLRKERLDEPWPSEAETAWKSPAADGGTVDFAVDTTGASAYFCIRIREKGGAQ